MSRVGHWHGPGRVDKFFREHPCIVLQPDRFEPVEVPADAQAPGNRRHSPRRQRSLVSTPHVAGEGGGQGGGQGGARGNPRSPSRTGEREGSSPTHRQRAAGRRAMTVCLKHGVCSLQRSHRYPSIGSGDAIMPRHCPTDVVRSPGGSSSVRHLNGLSRSGVGCLHFVQITELPVYPVNTPEMVSVPEAAHGRSDPSGTMPRTSSVTQAGAGDGFGDAAGALGGGLRPGVASPIDGGNGPPVTSLGGGGRGVGGVSGNDEVGASPPSRPSFSPDVESSSADGIDTAGGRCGWAPAQIRRSRSGRGDSRSWSPGSVAADRTARVVLHRSSFSTSPTKNSWASCSPIPSRQPLRTNSRSTGSAASLFKQGGGGGGEQPPDKGSRDGRPNHRRMLRSR